MGKQFASENLPPDVQARADRMNLDENAVGEVVLPQQPWDDHTTGSEFQTLIRPGIIRAFEKYMYGKVPPRCEEVIYKVTSDGDAFDGLARRREVDIICRHKGDEQTLHLLFYTPKNAEGPVPLFFGLNFKGNHSTTPDPGVTFHPFKRYAPMIPGSLRWADNRADEDGRGMHWERWDMEKVLKHGFACATMCYWDIFPDLHTCFKDSIMRFFYTQEEWTSPERDTGAISAWVWGIQRALDYLEDVPEIDRYRMAVHGHSRLGKTSLWAGACDQRIALTISNCSGTCGSKLAHRFYGESFEWIQYWNPHWLRGDFERFVQHDTEFPIDQHLLMAAVAPRLLYVASGSLDVYADPRGEFEAAVAASPAWRISGGCGLGTTQFPAPGKLIGSEVGYYLREGEHAFTTENWDALLKFAEKHF